MAPRAWPASLVLLLGSVLVGSPEARAGTSPDSGTSSSDPSCATLQVSSAAAARSHSECPAVLVSITFDASTENCSSDATLFMSIEEPPRDVKTYGGESSAALEDKDISWTFPVLTVGAPLSLEFIVDLCGYCDTYSDTGKFNPIDSFHFSDNEGTVPNNLQDGYKLKLPCDGVEGEITDTIVATAPPSVSRTSPPISSSLSLSSSSSASASPSWSPAERASMAPSASPTAATEKTATPTSGPAETAQPSTPVIFVNNPTSTPVAERTSSPLILSTFSPVAKPSTAPITETAPPSSGSTEATQPETSPPTRAEDPTNAPTAERASLPTDSPVAKPSTAPIEMTAPPSSRPTEAAQSGTSPPTSVEHPTSAPTAQLTSPMTLPTSSPVARSSAAPAEQTAPPSSGPTEATTAETPPPTPAEDPTTAPATQRVSPSPPPTSSPTTKTSTAPIVETVPPSSGSTEATQSETSPPTSVEGLTTAPSSLPSASPSSSPVAKPSTAPASVPTAQPALPLASPASSPVARSSAAPAEQTAPPSSGPTETTTAGTLPPTPAEDVTTAPTTQRVSPSPPPTSSPVTKTSTAPIVETVPPSSGPTDATQSETSPPTSVEGLTTAPSSLPSASPSSSPVAKPSTAPASVPTAQPALPLASPASSPVARPSAAPAEQTAPPSSGPTKTTTAGTLPPTPVEDPTTAPTTQRVSPSPPPTSSPVTKTSTAPIVETVPPSSEPTEATQPETSPPTSVEDPTAAPATQRGSFPSAPPTSSPVSGPSTAPVTETMPPSSGPMEATHLGTSPPTSIENPTTEPSPPSALSTSLPVAYSSTAPITDTVPPSSGPSEATQPGTPPPTSVEDPTSASTSPPSASPTSSPAAKPSFSPSSQGLTIEIRSVFEARRRALGSEGEKDLDGDRRALAIVYEEETEEYDVAMLDVCAAVLGVDKEDIKSVSTDFGPDGALSSTVQGTLGTSSSNGGSNMAPSYLTPVTTCEVDLNGANDSRAMAAATIVDRLLEPENFILLLDENSFGPVNAVISSVSFWQDECKDDTCPAGDGSYASIFPVETAATEDSIAAEVDDSEDKLFWFVLITAAMAVLVLGCWLGFCFCCGVKTNNVIHPRRTRQRSPKDKTPQRKKRSPSLEQRYSVNPFSGSSSRSNSSHDNSNSVSRHSNMSPLRAFSVTSGRRTPPPPVNTADLGKDGVSGPFEPPSPGEADWRRKFGLGPSRDSSYRSAPISPKFANHSISSGSSRGSHHHAVSPFYTTAKTFDYKDQVVAAADGKSGTGSGSGTGSRTGVTGGSSSSRSSGSKWQVTDEINANVQHTNDPVVRESLEMAAGVSPSTAISSPRKELNRLREALNQPSAPGVFDRHMSNTSTATVSSMGPSSRGNNPDSEPGISPATRYLRTHFGGRSTPLSSPIYEIDLDAEDAMAGIGGGRGGNGSSQRAHMRACSASGSKFQMSPCSTPARCPTPCERSDVSSSTFASGVKGEPAVAYSTDAVTMSTLAAAAAVAAANVGLPETTYRPPHSANSSPRRRSTGSVESEDSHGSGAPPSMPPLPPNQNQLSQKEKDGGGLSGRGGGGGEGGQARVTVVTGNRRGAGGRRGAHGSSDVPKELPSWGGVLSGFACLSLTEDPSTSTAAAGGETSTASRGSWVTSDSTGSHSNSSGTSASSYLSSVPGSRLPEVSSESDDDEQPGRASITSVVNRHLARLPASSGSGGGGGGGVGAGTPGDRRGNSSSRPISLDRAIAFSRGRTITPDLTPVAEVAGEDNAFFSDSDTDSDISSLASSVSGAGGSNSGGRRISRDPAMLLAAAIAKAGQVESIPAPSAGSPEQRRRLPPLEEGVPLSRAMLSPSYVSPPPRGETARSCVKRAGQERALVSPGEGARWSGSESCRAPTAGTLVVGVRARILQYEEKNASIRDNGLASLGDLESVHDDPMSMREQTPPLSLGRPDLATPAAAADVAPASEPTAVVDATPARSSGFSLRNAFSLFLGKKGGVSGSSSENKDDSAAESECDEAMGDAPSAFFHDGERALGEAGSDDAEDLTAVSPMGSSLDDLPGLVLPTPEDGLYRGPGEKAFSRSDMNQQSPEPLSPLSIPPPASGTLRVPPISATPASVLPSMTTNLATPETAPDTTGRVSESPMYDRAEIARAMAHAADGSEFGGDGGSDITIPNGSTWPSARREMLAAMSPMSDLTSRSSSDGVDDYHVDA
eukprot:jgi/Undpi1/14205/HiC_scaffold_9.g03854.m1